MLTNNYIMNSNSNASEALNRIIGKMNTNESLRRSIKEASQIDLSHLVDDLELLSDILLIGIVVDKLVVVEIESIQFVVNLSTIIKLSFLYQKPETIDVLIQHQIDVYQCEPRVVIMAVECGEDQILDKLIDLKVPIDGENYRAVCRLVEYGKLDLLKKMMSTYDFHNDLEKVIIKVCIQAIIHERVDILSYAISFGNLENYPDILFFLFIKNIESYGHLSIVKYFIDHRMDYRQKDYQAVKCAIRHDRGKIVEYFYKLDENIINFMTVDQKNRFGLIKTILMNKYIGTDKSCCISYDDIQEGDLYYECSNKLHQYLEDPWKQWIGKKSIWQCPHCFSSVKTICYVNKNSNK